MHSKNSAEPPSWAACLILSSLYALEGLCNATLSYGYTAPENIGLNDAKCSVLAMRRAKLRVSSPKFDMVSANSNVDYITCNVCSYS